MGETAADVKHDIEQTRERMSNTLAELERKLNVADMVREHPWPAIMAATVAGFALSGSTADVKAAAAAVAATEGASSKLGSLLDDALGSVLGGVHSALDERVTGWVSELKSAIGASAHTTDAPVSPLVPTRAD